MAIEEGKAAPMFTLPDAQRNTVALRELKGKDVVVYFYPRENTPGRTKQACAFPDLWGEIESLSVVVLGISPVSGAGSTLLTSIP